MPRATGCRKHKKGTNNVDQAIARDNRRAAALLPAAQTVEDLLTAHQAALEPEVEPVPVVYQWGISYINCGVGSYC